ncbi:uncharacterized protein LOC121416903 isoform X2 [Lytechinus variegatus]|uniref:uncharacterized protein LOC121416903 isoform X2 n=1 Tax=Lytechinus variegatus TaxID=7654 RepID=UPI001BB2A6AB|nr:uncharacterized protein LOC121416903 isoform X2 [Lytechinus variegatus]
MPAASLLLSTSRQTSAKFLVRRRAQLLEVRRRQATLFGVSTWAVSAFHGIVREEGGESLFADVVRPTLNGGGPSQLGACPSPKAQYIRQHEDP